MKVLYRIVNILLAAALFPCTLFLSFIHFGIKLDIADAAVVESLSLMRIINIVTGKDRASTILSFFESDSGSFLWPSEFQPINTRILIFVIAFFLMLVIGLFIIIWSICTKKRLPILIAAVLGLASVITMNTAFDSFAAEILQGNIDIVNALMGSGIIASLAGKFLSVSQFYLDGFQNADLFIYIALIAWTVIFYLLDLGDEEIKKEKEEEKAKKAAKKAAKAKKKEEKKAEKAKAEA